jgi:hypothetical protein
LDDFASFLRARGVPPEHVRPYTAAAERVLAIAGAGPVRPKHVDATVDAASRSGASPAQLAVLQKGGSLFVEYSAARASTPSPSSAPPAQSGDASTARGSEPGGGGRTLDPGDEERLPLPELELVAPRRSVRPADVSSLPPAARATRASPRTSAYGANRCPHCGGSPEVREGYFVVQNSWILGTVGTVLSLAMLFFCGYRILLLASSSIGLAYSALNVFAVRARCRDCSAVLSGAELSPVHAEHVASARRRWVGGLAAGLVGVVVGGGLVLAQLRATERETSQALIEKPVPAENMDEDDREDAEGDPF